MSYLRATFGLIALGAMLFHPALESAAQEGPSELTYVLVPDKSADIEAAIDSAIAQMSFIKRPIARSRLKKTNPAYQRIAISHTAGEVSVAFDGRKPIRTPAAGTPTPWTREDGEEFLVSTQWQGDALIQTLKAEDGERVNTFGFTPDRSGLTLDVIVTSGQLPVPVKYSLAYRRTT